ncbi:MAG: AAA family ATPase [Bryobacterales bacterium]|nr:AAA family ATPase [Bryobacterales bacterium]
MTRQKVILLVGLPGSGKSTYAARHGWPVLESDEMRRLLLDDARDQGANRTVFALLRRLLRMRLELGRPVTCVDATNLTAIERRPYVMTAHMYGAEIEAVFFDVPVHLCMKRNLTRARVVPAEVVERMAARLVPPGIAEGFSAVHLVRD